MRSFDQYVGKIMVAKFPSTLAKENAEALKLNSKNLTVSAKEASHKAEVAKKEAHRLKAQISAIERQPDIQRLHQQLAAASQKIKEIEKNIETAKEAEKKYNESIVFSLRPFDPKMSEEESKRLQESDKEKVIREAKRSKELAEKVHAEEIALIAAKSDVSTIKNQLALFEMGKNSLQDQFDKATKDADLYTQNAEELAATAAFSSKNAKQAEETAKKLEQNELADSKKNETAYKEALKKFKEHQNLVLETHPTAKKSYESIEELLIKIEEGKNSGKISVPELTNKLEGLYNNSVELFEMYNASLKQKIKQTIYIF